MSNDFLACVEAGNKVRTKDLGKGKYVHFCIDKNGKTYAGEVRTKEKKHTRSQARREIRKEQGE